MLAAEQQHLLGAEANSVSAQPEPEPEAAVSYGDWLARHGFEDKLDELSEWDIKEPAPGSRETPPLEKLETMLAEEEEDLQDMLDELFEGDKEAQTKFRDAVAVLKEDGKQRAAAAAAAAASDPWTELRQVLGNNTDGESKDMESIVRAKDEEIATKDGVIAAKDVELEKLRARLAVLGEAAPPETQG
jgi:hypothetical protein